MGRFLRGRLAAAAWVAIAAQACLATSPVASPNAPPMTLSVSNGTTIAVQLAINGSVIETVSPGGYQDPITATLPTLPWTVAARTTSGRVLVQMTVRAGDVVYTTPDPSGSSSARGDGMRVDLSCGRLDVWSGPPLLGPAPGPGQPGDCQPGIALPTSPDNEACLSDILGGPIILALSGSDVVGRIGGKDLPIYWPRGFWANTTPAFTGVYSNTGALFARPGEDISPHTEGGQWGAYSACATGEGIWVFGPGGP